MKSVILLLGLLGILLASGCTSSGDVIRDLPDSSEENDSENNKTPYVVPEISDVIELCNSLCQTNAEAYCSEERTIEVKGQEITGTCRAFSRKGNIPGFSRCQGFCTEFDAPTTTVCTVDGQKDPYCGS